MGASISWHGPQIYLQLLVLAGVVGALIWALRR